MNRRRFFKLVGGGVAGGATFGSGVGIEAVPEEPRLLVAPPKQFIEPWTPSPLMEDLLNRSRHEHISTWWSPVSVQASWWEGGYAWMNVKAQDTHIWLCDGIAKIRDDLSFQIDSIVDPEGITLVVYQRRDHIALAETKVHVSGLTGKIEIVNDAPMLGRTGGGIAMGMFDWVRVPGLRCYRCGEEMPEKGWQSKSGECWLDEVEPKDVKDFYQACPGCDAWNEYVTDREITLRGVKLVTREEEEDDD